MKAHWWSCVLGLLCMPAEVMLSTWAVYQDPLSISRVTVNSSTKITCSTSLSDPMGFYLLRGVHGRDVVYLNFENGEVTKKVIASEFSDRIIISEDRQNRGGFRVTFQLSPLGLEDTDWYYCSWRFYRLELEARETLSSNGTIIIVRERDPQEQCKSQVGDLIFIALSVTAFTVVLVLFTGAVTVRCKRFKKKFRPARDAKPSRPHRHQHICPQDAIQHCPYLITSTSANTSDFRGLL